MDHLGCLLVVLWKQARVVWHYGKFGCCVLIPLYNVTERQGDLAVWLLQCLQVPGSLGGKRQGHLPPSGELQ